jgi:glycosyltransferase involved in cell wall biosynthesis
MNKVKLLVVYPIDPFGEKYGGIETVIRSSMRESPENFEVELVGVIKRDSVLRLCEWQGISFEGKKIRFFPVLSVENLNACSLIPLTLKFTLALFFYKHKINFRDRIIVFHRLEPAYVLSNIKEKKILFIHGDTRNFSNRYCESKWKKVRSLYYFLEQFFIKQMGKVFVVSQKGCEYYRNKYPRYASCFKFLPTWYDPAIFHKVDSIKREEILSKYKILDKRPIILFVGRLELPKDPLLLINSFFLISKRYPNSQLIIIGEGTLRQEIIEKVNSLLLGENVIFLGKMSQTEIAEIMKISDLFLLTSRFEGMPLVFLESLACGLPVVATNVGENYLVIKDGISGKLVSSFNPEEVAEAAIEVISNPPSPHSCMEVVSEYAKQKIFSHLLKEIEGVISEPVEQ